MIPGLSYMFLYIFSVAHMSNSDPNILTILTSETVSVTSSAPIWRPYTGSLGRGITGNGINPTQLMGST